MEEKEEEKKTPLGESLESQGYTGVSAYLKAFSLGAKGTTEDFIEKNRKRQEEKNKLLAEEAKRKRDLTNTIQKGNIDIQKQLDELNMKKDKAYADGDVQTGNNYAMAMNNMLNANANYLSGLQEDGVNASLQVNMDGMDTRIRTLKEINGEQYVILDEDKNANFAYNETSQQLEKIVATDSVTYDSMGNAVQPEGKGVPYNAIKVSLEDDKDVKTIKAWNNQTGRYDIFNSNREFNAAYNNNPNTYNLDHTPTNQNDTAVKALNIKEDMDATEVAIEAKKSEIETAVKLGQKKEANKLKVELAKLKSEHNKKTNELNAISGSTGKQNKNKIMMKYNEKNPNLKNIEKREVIADLKSAAENKEIDFSDATDSKSISIMIAQAGEEQINNMIDKTFEEQGDDKGYATMLPLLKVEGTQKGDLVTNKIYNDKKLSSMSFFLGDEYSNIKPTEKTGKFIEFATRFKNGAGNKDRIEQIYNQAIKPIEYGMLGKSGELYKESWDLASKRFDDKYTSMFSDAPLATFFSEDSVGFEDFSEAIASLQDYVNDYNNGFGNLVRDLWGNDTKDINAFINNTFPKLQIADMISKEGEGELLNPIDFMEILATGYRAGAFGDEMGAKVIRGSELERLLLLSRKIKY